MHGGDEGCDLVETEAVLGRGLVPGDAGEGGGVDLVEDLGGGGPLDVEELGVVAEVVRAALLGVNAAFLGGDAGLAGEGGVGGAGEEWEVDGWALPDRR